LAPYTYVRILEQIKAVVPLAAYLVSLPDAIDS
jgi:hypothetical protein